MHLDTLPGSFFGPSNLVELLRHRAQHQADDPGLSIPNRRREHLEVWTYADVDRKARAIAASLQSMGMEGERALLLYPSGLDFVAAFFGCLYAGVMAVPAYPPRRNRNMARIDAIANDAEAKIALTTFEVLERVQTMIADTPALQRIRWRATDQWDDDLAEQWRRPDVHGDTLAFLQYTSGSTGTPKGVMLTHANLMHNSAMITYAFEHSRSGSGCFWLPLYHDMGLIGGILQPLYMGRPNTLMSPTHFLAEARAVAAGDLAVGPHDQRRAELRLRPVREKVTAEQKRSLGSEPLDAGVQRGRAGAGRHDRPVQQGVRRVRLPPRGVLPVLRPGRGDADRHRRVQAVAAGGAIVRRRGAGKARGRRRWSGQRQARASWSAAAATCSIRTS